MTSSLPDTFTQATRDWPPTAQAAFARLRDIVHDTADGVADLSLLETLKWGQPSWLPDRPRIGSTLRVGWSPQHPGRITLFVHCQTTLAETMRTLYPAQFQYDGNRALHIDLDAPLPEQAIAHCAHLTLTYHRKTA